MTDKRDRPFPPSITNTTQQSPLLHLLGAMDDQQRRRPQGSFIEDMEAQGQRELASQTTQLPTKGSEDPAWAKMGVIFGAAVEGDAIWRKVTLPEGWKVVPTDHSMWSNLVDAKGTKRAAIFYKAAFYDRSCHIYPECRYVVDRQYASIEFKNDDDRRQRSVVKDRATGKLLLEPEWIDFINANTDEEREQNRKRYDAQYMQAADCEKWLKEHFPDFKDASAYWD